MKLPASRLSSSWPAGLDALGEVAGLGHRARLASVRRVTGATAARETRRPSVAGDGDSGERDDDQEGADPVERFVDLGQRPAIWIAYPAAPGR